MTGIAENLVKQLPSSPADLSNPKTIKKIQQYMPVPTDYKIIWADIEHYGGYPAGIVLTEQGIIFKAPKDVLDAENARRKEHNKELRNAGHKEDQQDMMSVLYQIIPWEYYESSQYHITSKHDKRGKWIYFLSYGDTELTHFTNPDLRKFFRDYAIEEQKQKQIIADVSSSSVFSGVGTVDLENTAFHAAYGADQSKTGHGIYAEQAGVILDRTNGESSSAVGQDLDENGRYIKDGPDKIVNGAPVQCKYCKTASNSVRACFRKNANGVYEYRYFDAATGKPMQVEVPRDQYDKAVEAMRKRIESGQVPGVTNPKMAEKLVRQGKLTYQQARNLAKAGTFESLTYDAVTGVVSCAAMCGISALASFGLVYWRTGDVKKASNAALSTGIEVFGPSFAARILSAQIARSGLSNVLIPATNNIAKSLDPKLVQRIINAFRQLAGKGNIYGAAAQNSFAKALRTTALSQGIVFIVFSIPDTLRMVNKKISGAQYAKNMTSLAASFAGYAGGTFAAGIAIGKVGEKAGKKVDKKIGSAVGFVAGAVGGTITSATTRAVGNLFHEDDAVITSRLFNAAFSNMCLDYMLSDEEVDQVIKQLDDKSKEIAKLQRNLLASNTQYHDIVEFLEPIIENVIANRAKIDGKLEKQMITALDEIICDEVEKEEGEAS